MGVDVCFKGVSRVYQGYFKELSMVSVSRQILRVFQCSFKGISKKLRKFQVSFQEVFKGSLKHINSLSNETLLLLLLYVSCCSFPSRRRACLLFNWKCKTLLQLSQIFNKQVQTLYRRCVAVQSLIWKCVGESYLAEEFRQITIYLAEQFRQITRYLAEQFRQIAHYLADHPILTKNILFLEFEKSTI